MTAGVGAVSSGGPGGQEPWVFSLPCHLGAGPRGVCKIWGFPLQILGKAANKENSLLKQG